MLDFETTCEVFHKDRLLVEMVRGDIRLNIISNGADNIVLGKAKAIQLRAWLDAAIPTMPDE